MPKRPRLYLFHGNDSHASSRELRRWTEHFRSKHGDVTLEGIQADAVKPEELFTQLRQAVETLGLFATPRLVVMKRVSALPAAKVKELLTYLGGQLATLPEQLTLVFWDDSLLSANHPLRTWFVEREAAGQGTVKQFRVIAGRQLIDTLVAQSGTAASLEAKQWLYRYLQRLEKEQRLLGKVRASEELTRDLRVWAAQNLLTAASLLVPEGKQLTPAELERVEGAVSDPVSPFEIINAVSAHRWERARVLTHQWEREDEGAYFGLVSLLRNHFLRVVGGPQGALGQYALELLAEVEVISKNISLRQAWLLDLFFTRLSVFTGDGAGRPLVTPRRLWLSHVQRVD